jgi:ribosome biogenesis GTPase A/prefoldin subunit 5
MEELLKELKIALKELQLEHLARFAEDFYHSLDKTHIAFVGEYNAGKSSLINTLLGKKILAERDLPTTNRVVLVTDCPVEKREHLDQYTELVCVKDPKLEHIVLVDTPGLSSAIREHEDALMRYLHKADLIVIVAPSNQPYTKEIELLLNLLRDRHSTQWAYVINIFEDPSVYEEDPTKLQRLKEFVKEKLRNILSAEDVENTPIFAFSVRAVRKGLNDYPLVTQEWEAFRKFIFEEVAERAKKLKFASLKEKVLKLLSGREVLEKEAKLESLLDRKREWEELKENVLNFAQKSLKERLENIDRHIDLLVEVLKKDIEEVLARYSSPQIARNPQRLLEELEQNIKVKFLVTDWLSDVERLLDYRPDFVKMKKLFPTVAVEPTIPPNLQSMKNRLGEDISKLPTAVGKPGALAKWLLIPSLLLVGGGIYMLLSQRLEIGLALILLGGLLTAFSLYRVLGAKRILQRRLEERLNRLRDYYKKLYGEYYRERFGEKLEKVTEYLDTNIERLNAQISSLSKKLQKLKEVREKITRQW